MVTTLQEIVEIKEKSLKEIIPKEQIISITNLEVETYYYDEREHEESSFERRQREKQEREGYQEPEIEDDPNDNFPFYKECCI